MLQHLTFSRVVMLVLLGWLAYHAAALTWERPRSVFAIFLDMLEERINPPPNNTEEWRIWCTNKPKGRVVENAKGEPIECKWHR